MALLLPRSKEMAIPPWLNAERKARMDRTIQKYREIDARIAGSSHLPPAILPSLQGRY